MNGLNQDAKVARGGVTGYRRLSRNVVFIIVTVSLVPLYLTGAIILRQFQEAYQIKVGQHIGELIHKHSQNIDAFLYDRLGDLRVLARSSSLSELQDRDYLSFRLRLLREEFGGSFVDLGLVDDQGRQVAYAGPFNLAEADYAQADWFEKTLHREDYISDVFDGLRGAPHFIVAVRQFLGGRQWILRATLDFQAFNTLVEGLVVGRSGFAFILNRRGEFQTNVRYQVLKGREPYLAFLNSPQADRLGPHKAAHMEEHTDEDGLKWLVAMSPLKNGQWVLCFQQKAEDAFLVLTRAWRFAMLAILGGSLAIIAAAWFIASKITSNVRAVDREKEEMNEKIMETDRLASIGELAAGIAHEINNPVAIMIEEAGWIDDLLEDEDSAAVKNLKELLRASRQIKTQGIRCKEITHKLLSFARKTDPKIIDVNLNKVVNDTIGMIRQKSRWSHVRLEKNLSTNLPAVAASPSELQQVIFNLLGNAVDAMDAKGGVVTVSTAPVENSVLLEVADTGRGIPPAILERIFDPFFTTKPVGRGTGLGLSICFGIIDKLGGDISVRSTTGQGSVFTVKLPRTPFAPSPENGASRPCSGSAGGRKLLDRIQEERP
jgi:two-component system NtrC family sensor kinase